MKLLTTQYLILVAVIAGTLASPGFAETTGQPANCDPAQGAIDLDKCHALRQKIERAAKPKKCEGNQLEMEYCAGDTLRKRERVLREELQRYEATIMRPNDIRKLNDAQGLWLKFRNADCAAVVSDDDRRGVALLQWYDCLTERTNHRITEIRKLAQCTDNGCRPEQN